MTETELRRGVSWVPRVASALVTTAAVVATWRLLRRLGVIEIEYGR